MVLERLRASALSVGLAGVVGLATVSSALAAQGDSLFGDATVVSPGNASPHAVQLRSDSDPGYGGVDFNVPAGTTFADLNSLATDYKFEADDTCGNGSPRFQINVTVPNVGTKNIFV